MGLKMRLKQLIVVKNLSKTKHFMKNKFDSDDDLPLNKQLKPNSDSGW